jgi:DNA-binding CsgD family transcriptional regulator
MPTQTSTDEPLNGERIGPADFPVIFSPLPGGAAATSFKSASSTSLTPLVCDERAIARLLSSLISRGGLSIGEVSRRLGVTTNSVRQYLRGRRNKPSLMWFVRFAEICGARVVIEWPERKR